MAWRRERSCVSDPRHYSGAAGRCRAVRAARRGGATGGPVVRSRISDSTARVPCAAAGWSDAACSSRRSRSGSARRRSRTSSPSRATARRSSSPPRRWPRSRAAAARRRGARRRRRPALRRLDRLRRAGDAAHPASSKRLELQRSLIRSHAAGSGDEVEREVVRALMLLRLSTLATGRTGVRPVVATSYARDALRRDHAGRARVRLARLLRRPRAARALRAGADGGGAGARRDRHAAATPARRCAAPASSRSCCTRRRASR